MATLKHRIARIRAEVSIARVLFDLGYPVHPNNTVQKEAFPCDLHGDGIDSKPSAMLYPESNTWQCFACSTNRDAIRTLRDKKGLSPLDAVRYLEQTYNLPPLPWGDEESDEPPVVFRSEMEAALDMSATLEDDLRSIQAMLTWLTEERSLPMDTILAGWEVLDKIDHLTFKKELEEKQARQTIRAIRTRLEKEMHAGHPQVHPE